MRLGRGLRSALYHRFHVLVPFVSNRLVRGLGRALVWGFWLAYFGFVLTILALRYSVLPHIEDYRTDIERLASQGLGQTVSIGRIEASWEGINPDLTLLDVRIADADGLPALAFSRIEAILSWWSVPSAQLTLRLLRIDEPTLNLRRHADGHIFIAGIPLSQEQSDNDVSDWVLAQKRIRIRGATLVWEDELRGAPALVLEDLNFSLDNDGKHHRFGLTALPPEVLAAKIDVRGDFKGKDIDQFESWSGQVYGEIGYADLAVWQQWIDYPLSLPRGRGALRAWLAFADGGPSEISADISLQDVSLSLAKDLPALDLAYLSGHLGGKISGPGFALTGRRVELEISRAFTQGHNARETILIEPMDFQVNWQPEPDGKTVVGSASASRIDLGALAKLADHFPFDPRARQALFDFAPRGQVSGLSAQWNGDAEHLQTYSVKAGFEALALKARGAYPGTSGLSGTLEANDKGGSATLRSKDMTIDLPGVFPESLIALDTLNAYAKWKISEGVVDAVLTRAEFAGPEAAGTAQGKYHYTGKGPGTIDLNAALVRADARAVWRYMPHVVGENARYWLRDSLLSGGASEAKLTLKGDLANFPFLDKSKGQFLVTVKAHDVVLDYAKGWPRIEGIDGDLRFEGNGMTVEAHHGSILGAQLSHTRAVIPDFDAPISTLTVKGSVDGATSEFLKFIENSPVAERINHFTDDMRASGNGHLDLGLVIPLDEAKLDDSKIDGTYRLMNNELTVDAALPPIKQVNGNVQFSGDEIQVSEINSVFLGGPLKIKGGSQKDGKVLITANGLIDIAQLRKQSGSPLLGPLSGSTPYRAEVRINKRNADLAIDSRLVGLASAFPEPLGKAASDTMPLHFEKKLLPSEPVAKGKIAEVAVRDQIDAALGNFLSIQLIRKQQPGGFLTERGAIAIGRPLQLPDAGVTLSLSAKKLDIDYWRRLLRSTEAVASAGTKPSPPFVDSINIKTDDLQLFGRHYNDADLSVAPGAAQWKIRMASRQANGDLQWDVAEQGKLTARFKNIAFDSSTEPAGPDIGEVIKELPALDIVADEFSIGIRRFGRLELQANNEGSVWQLNRIQMSNPHGNLSGKGQWQIAGGKNLTHLDFKIDSGDVGKLLERLGYPGTLRAGKAQLGGKLEWSGPPTSLDYASLSGDMSLEASNGQFLKLDPGAAGKLLGLISLQGLPRRISLDFKDVFSQGFAFDSIAGKVSVASGMMRTERLQIDGPSARVVMRGEVDLKNETQRLNVNVQPELGGTAALGVGIINPIAGVATLFAQKLLQNPLNRMFGFDYLITGKWDDPKVEKLTGNEPGTNVPRLPSTSNPAGVASESPIK
ncbi:YhdP family protein [Propionivibrio sp.]|uniref:YhdP family protein n=1 Tax=Propionivibrio sp. TaxID=2212460 RepID=UPI00262365DD|nr:YhdP family protein [Propionivibrio sp.]